MSHPSAAAQPQSAPMARLGRASGLMAAGTLLSRVTGFLRTIAIGVAIGTHEVGDAYNVANTTPNILYDLLLGGVLSSVIVPVLVRAAKEDEDGGEAFASSLLTLVAIALSLAVLVGMVAAPWLIRAYSSRDAGIPLATTFLRWFLPQVLFYGLGATIGAILNTRGRFGAPMLAPVLNNLVVIATVVLFVLLPGHRPPTLESLTTGQIDLLAAGTTLGIVVMTLALLPSLRASGFRYRPRIDLRHPGLRRAARLAGWMLAYVLASQAAYLVVTRLATSTVAYTTYTFAYQMFLLPHGIIVVSVVTALLPRMSAHAAEGRLDLVRDDLSSGLRLAGVVLVPAAAGLLVLAGPLASAVFQHGAVNSGAASAIGTTLAAFAVALPPFSAFQLSLRAFYATADSRTPALLGVGVGVTNVLSALLLSALLSSQHRAVALALAFALSYTAGTAASLLVLRRRLDGLDGPRVVRTLVRVTLASAVAALVALAVVLLARRVLPDGPGADAAAVLAGGGLGAAAYLGVALGMRVAELDAMGGLVRRRLGS